MGDASATLFIVISVGGLGLGWLLWEVSKLFAKPLAFIVPFVIGGVAAAAGGDALRYNPGLATAIGVVGAITAALATQMFFLVGNIASLESQVVELKRLLGPNLPETLQAVGVATASVPGNGPIVDHAIKTNDAGIVITITVNGEGDWLLKLFAATAESAYPNSTSNLKDLHPLQGSGRLKVNYGWEPSGERYWWAVLYRDQRVLWRTDLVDRESMKAPAAPEPADPAPAADRDGAAQ